MSTKPKDDTSPKVYMAMMIVVVIAVIIGASVGAYYIFFKEEKTTMCVGRQCLPPSACVGDVCIS